MTLFFLSLEAVIFVETVISLEAVIFFDRIGAGVSSLVWDSSRGTSGMFCCGAVRSTMGWVGGWSRQVMLG